MIDAYPDVSDTVLAHIGLAEMLARQGETAEALGHWHDAPDSCPPIIVQSGRFANCMIAWSIFVQREAERPAARVLRLVAETGLDAELITQISQINQTQPDEWFALPVQKRAMLVRKLIAADQLELAQQTLDAAYADRPDRKSATALHGLLVEAIRDKVEAALSEIERLIASGKPEAAITLATKALERRPCTSLQPEDNLEPNARLYSLRGEARLAMGHDLAALDDFYAVANSGDAFERDAARKSGGAGFWSGAGTSAAHAPSSICSIHDDPDVLALTARLDRRERGEPVVLISADDESRHGRHAQAAHACRRTFTAISRWRCAKSAFPTAARRWLRRLFNAHMPISFRCSARSAM